MRLSECTKVSGCFFFFFRRRFLSASRLVVGATCQQDGCRWVQLWEKDQRRRILPRFPNPCRSGTRAAHRSTLLKCSFLTLRPPTHKNAKPRLPKPKLAHHNLHLLKTFRIARKTGGALTFFQQVNQSSLR